MTTSTPSTSTEESPTDEAGHGKKIPAPRVFWPSAILLIAFVALALIAPSAMNDVLSKANDTVVGELGWFYVITVTGFVFYGIWLVFSPMGSIVLGKPEDDPEFSLPSWFAMLFAAGMGIGLVFWGVAEPLNHFSSPPPGTASPAPARARAAMDSTFLHWGLHAWAIYVVVGLAVAYAVHRKGRSVSIRWALEPLLGDRVKGWLGDVIDILAVVGTLFGVATSLGFGVSQVGAGLGHLGVAKTDDTGTVSTGLLVILIIGITAVATISVVTGVDKGNEVPFQPEHGRRRPAHVGRAAARPDDGPAQRFRAADRLVPAELPVDELPHLRIPGRGRQGLVVWMDHLLLGLVDQLVAVRRRVHRPYLARSHRPRVRRRCAAGADPAGLPFSVVLILMTIATGKELLGAHAEQVHGRRRKFEKSIRDEMRREFADLRSPGRRQQ